MTVPWEQIVFLGSLLNNLHKGNLHGDHTISEINAEFLNSGSLQLVLFFEDIRSERLLMRQMADRLSVRWDVGYDLGEPLPDHSSLSRTRLCYGLEVFRRFFETIVEQCQQA